MSGAVESSRRRSLPFPQVYAEHREPLIRFTCRLAARYGLPDPRRDAEDIVQTTFEDALRCWSKVSHAPAWLYTVARRKVRKVAGEAARHGVPTDGHVLDSTESRGWTSMALRPTAEDTILARQVMDSIADLPDRQRMVTYLRHVQGWTVREVADLLDCAPGTVWAHTNHGVMTLRSGVADRDTSVAFINGPCLIQFPWIGCLLAAVGVAAGLAVILYLVIRAVFDWVTGTGWSRWGPEVGVGAAIVGLVVVLIMTVRAGVRSRRQRRPNRR